MKNLICLSVVTVVLWIMPSRLQAIGGSIGVFSDWSATGCELTDRVGVVTVAIVHVLSDGTTGCDYSAPPPLCANWTFLDENPSFGSPNAGFFGGSSPTGRQQRRQGRFGYLGVAR